MAHAARVLIALMAVAGAAAGRSGGSRKMSGLPLPRMGRTYQREDEAMSAHTLRSLPKAASLTRLKGEATALRHEFASSVNDARERVAAQVSPAPLHLTKELALLVIAREYGFGGWPALKRTVEGRTWTVYADSEGVGEALAGVLSGVTVTVAESLASALECDSEILVLELEERREGRLDSATVTRLRGRKMVVTGPGANWLCRELDLEIGGWMVGSAQSLRTAGSWGGTEWAKVPFEAFARPLAEDAFGVRGRDPRHISWQRVPEELGLEGEHGFIETLVHLDQDVAYGLMMRQANCIFAGVMAHPDEWSHVYRDLFSRAVGWLAARQTEEFRVAVVPRPQHPPGTVRFTLDPLDGAEVGAHRRFFFRFDRPTVFAAVLKHGGSTAVELAFVGGRRALHATRTIAGHGEPLSVTVTVGDSAIKQMGDRYWTLDVLNFDVGNGMSAELTVRYDAVDGGSIQPMPSDASFEQFHWFAERMAVGDGPMRRQATADAFGLDDWRTLQGHVAWSAAKPPEDGAPMREMYLARAKARYGESFGLEELLEFHVAQIETSAGLRRALEDAFATAAEQGHEAAGVEHLLLALLDDAVAKDVLVKCGADADELRHGLVDSFKSANPVGAPGVSPELFGVLVRTSLYRALGRKGSNTANVLAGVFAEECRARDLLREQGLSRDDVMRYLVFGIPKSLSDAQPTKGVLAAQVERALYDAYQDAETKRHEAFGVDHLLLALVGQPSLVGQLAAEVDLRCMGSELAEFVATTPVGDGQPRPTRTLDSAMQRATAGLGMSGYHTVSAESLVEAVGVEAGTFAADVLGRYRMRTA